MLTQQSTLTVALVGNPNTGKSTLFSALVGMHQHVGNYPGVTVEKKTGHMEIEGRSFEIIDLPGLYSLAPRSRDEMVSVDVLLGDKRTSARSMRSSAWSTPRTCVETSICSARCWSLDCRRRWP